MVAQSLTCPECNAPLEPPPDRTQFFCRFCGSTVVIPSEFQSTHSNGDSQSDVLRPAPDLSKFTIEKFGDELTISWSWRTWMLLFLIPFALFWNGIVIGMGVGIFAMGNWLFMLGYFFIPHVWIGAFLVYLIASMLFNRTVVSVNRDRLQLRHGPVPWKNPKPIDVADLQQLYVKEKISHGKNGSSASYELHALLKDGSSQTLCKSQSDDNIPIALERMIEVHLGIRDQPVQGEHR